MWTDLQSFKVYTSVNICKKIVTKYIFHFAWLNSLLHIHIIFGICASFDTKKGWLVHYYEIQKPVPGVQMVGSKLNCTWQAQKENPSFFFLLQFFVHALLSECLEQARDPEIKTKEK